MVVKISGEEKLYGIPKLIFSSLLKIYWYRAHCAVISAIAQFPCISRLQRVYLLQYLHISSYCTYSIP